ncbi:DUF2773 domain-containing protein, partial [Escherichia coli]|nr:DUF2773 domain-containing protein [Escherichia coli]MCV5281557.1 DUF2773 domain-containing protein [Escherichia coli]
RAYCLKTQPATGETYPKSDLFNKAVDVLKARLKRDPLLALELVNPELDLVRQLALNGKTRAIREQAMRKLDELY